MTDPDPTSTREVQRTIDREVALLTSAVDLVASGGAPSTLVGGLRLGEAVLVIVGPIAVDRGVILEPLWTADESGVDVRVRRVVEAT
jgi:hypothetical protein